MRVGGSRKGRRSSCASLPSDASLSAFNPRLSRVGTPARFNMPFEFGLSCALSLTYPDNYEVFVLDSQPYRIDRILSDYKGRDPLIHRGTCDGVVAALLDTFKTDIEGAPGEFRSAARALRRSAQRLKRDMRAESIFRPALFRLLVAAATRIAIEREFIKA